MLVALAGFTQAAGARECSLAGVAGKYGYTSNGTIVAPPVGPFAAVGHFTLTRTGTLTGEQTTSIAGNLAAETFNGTYQVNRDCTGSATAFVYRGTTLVRTSTLDAVWDDNQRELRSIFRNAGTTITFTARKMFSGDDEDED
jgi:hypothetical protein